MKSRWTKYVLALLFAVVCLPNLAVSQEADPHKMGREKMEEMMNKWAEMMKPGPHHKQLARFIGKWDTVTTIPGMGTSRGEAEIRWLIEGRWLITEAKYTMMGRPASGFAIEGYDNFKKKYVAMWVDSTNTALLTMSGTVSPDGKTKKLRGLMDEPLTGEVGKHVEYVTRVIDDNKFIFEIHDLAIGGDKTKVVEIVYTRKAV
jgi:hypothetical protein